MTSRGQLPNNLFTEDTYTIAPQLPKNLSITDSRWLPQEPEGQLSVDVFETPEAIVVTAPIAGVKPEDLEIYVSNDLVTIRGKREDCTEHLDRQYLFKECYWGQFSRSVILPTHISSDQTEATLKSGILTIVLPKLKNSLYIPVSEVYDDSL